MDASNVKLPTCYKMACAGQTVSTRVATFITGYVLSAILHVPRVLVVGLIIACSVRICIT